MTTIFEPEFMTLDPVALAAPAVAVPMRTTSALVLDSSTMDKMIRLAEVMASGKTTLPTHLRGNTGDCMAIVMQAVQWNMNPFAVAQKTYLSPSGRLAYEGQLIASVINNSGLLQGRLKLEWFGPWENIIGRFKTMESRTKKDGHGEPSKYIVPDWKPADEAGLGIRVWETVRGEDAPRVLELLLAQVRTRHSTLWTEDPKQQIAYSAQARWGRLHTPDVILGVYMTDELEAPPMKDMGAAEVVCPWPDDIKAKGLLAASAGSREYASFWRAMDPDLRNKLVESATHKSFKEQALRADDLRTVGDTSGKTPTPPPPPPPAAPPPPAPGPDDTSGETVTFAQVEQMIAKGETPAALAVALDWANALCKEDEHRAADLLTIYEARLKAIGGGK